jgi:hypothetical protein
MDNPLPQIEQQQFFSLGGKEAGAIFFQEGIPN